MKLTPLSDAEVRIAWRQRVASYWAFQQTSARAAAWVIMFIGMLVVVPLFLPNDEIRSVFWGLAALLLIAAVPVLPVISIIGARKLRCPRCGLSPQGVGTDLPGGPVNAVNCDYCLAKLTDPPPKKPHDRDALNGRAP